MTLDEILARPVREQGYLLMCRFRELDDSKNPEDFSELYKIALLLARQFVEGMSLVERISGLVERLIPDNFEQYTLDQLRERAFGILWPQLSAA